MTTLRTLTPLLLLSLAMAGCKKYVPANLPLQLDDPAAGAEDEDTEYRDSLGRTIGGADADGPKLRITMKDGLQIVMKSPRLWGDSVVGYYRPTSGEPWARLSVSAFEVRAVEEETIDWLATSSLLLTPITLALLLTL